MVHGSPNQQCTALIHVRPGLARHSMGSILEDEGLGKVRSTNHDGQWMADLTLLFNF